MYALASCVAAAVGLPAIAGEGCPLCAAAAMAQSDNPTTGEALSAEPAAELFTDFADADHNARWQVVNDNVMGGRSIGELSFQSAAHAGAEKSSDEAAGHHADASMTFEGYINTNGGGFASIRLPLDDGALVGVTAIRLTLQADFRNIYLRIDDARPHRGRSINHRAPLNLDPEASTSGSETWQTVTVPLASLSPAWRGNPVPGAEPLDPQHATRLGLMLNDTQDGPFRVVVDRIELVR